MPTLLGIESTVRDQLKTLGYAPDAVTVENGNVTLALDTFAEAKRAVARLNYALGSAERVLFEIKSFPIRTFDDLIAGVEEIAWEDYVDFGYAIRVTGYSRKSEIFGISACQGIIKKAVVDRLLKVKGLTGRLPEDPKQGMTELHFSIIDNTFTVSLDTSGDGLHKRGYRPLRHEAPIRETLAFALLHYSFFPENIPYREKMTDLFCGSGTFLIEAALMLTKTAPGIRRHFAAETQQLFGREVFDREREAFKADSLLFYRDRDPSKYEQIEMIRNRLYGADASPQAIEVAEQNARKAGVEELIDFKCKAIETWTRDSLETWIGLEPKPQRKSRSPFLWISNPPYGERLGNRDKAIKLEEDIARLAFDNNYEMCRLSVISPDLRFEQHVGRKADKRRKVYNGMIRCTLYHYFRPNNRS